MSELAQRIVASHKAAAKRAVFHMGKTRKLKLSATESLELVACVLGVANWQTLLALANDGKGPRIDDGTLAVAAPAPAPVEAEEKSAAERLADYYGTPTSWGEHPKYTREDWSLEVENGDTGASYWNYVVSEIESWGDMFPWERDESFAVKLARLAGMEVEPTGRDDDETGWTLSDPHGLSFSSTQDSESEMWAIASDDVMKHLIQVFQLSQVVFNHMSENAWLIAATSYFTDGPKAPEAEQHREPAFDELEGYMMSPGEMTKDERKFSEAVALCRGLDIEALYSEAKAEEGKYWVAGFEFYKTEAEAWIGAARAVRDNVLHSAGISLEDWYKQTLHSQICLALDHSTLAATFKPAEVK
jgi:hypothetical protein